MLPTAADDDDCVLPLVTVPAIGPYNQNKQESLVLNTHTHTLREKEVGTDCNNYMKESQMAAKTTLDCYTQPVI